MAYRKIEDSKLTAIANAIRNKLRATATMTTDEMPNMIDSIGVGVVPSYWKTYLEAKATEINSALSAAGENKSAFLWYTDAHWTTNYGMSPVLLKYLSKHTGMAKTFFGGDISNAKSGEVATLTAWQELVKDIPNHHSVLGNHDNQVTDLPSGLSAFFIEPERTGDVVYGTDATNGKNYYYIDNHIENTRYICLSTGRMWTYADELSWCVDVLNSTPNGWHIVVISHLWLNNDYDNGTGIITTPERYTKVYLDLFDAYNRRESGTTEMHTVSYDFTNSLAKVEFIIGGHTHQDYDFSTANGIPVILTECDAWQERDDVSVVTKGTITENCVYGIVADYTAKTVRVINVGRGDTRSVAIPDVVTYTNWAKVAYAQGSTTTIYNNGKGYSEDVRINSSGTDTTGATGWDTTGYIPVVPDDIIRLKNCTVMNMSGITGTNRCRPVFYNESFAYVTESTSWSLDKNPPIANEFSPVYGENGDVIQFKVPTNYNSSIRYMRITVDDINENSIITVNEEIPETESGYTNALKTAIGTDGNPFNGGLGYKEQCRLSDGAETSASYFDTTGFIKATRGDTIRLRNITFCETTYEMSSVACYDANFTHLQTSPPFTTPDTVNAAWSPVASADGKDVIQFTIPTSYNAQTQYIRIVCSDINENSIITVNEEIGEPDNDDTPTYTNVLKTAIGFDGAVLDGKGYRDGARHSTSSNAFSSIMGWDCTGLIPCKQGDVIRLKNISFYYSEEYNSANSDRGRIVYHDETYTRINETKTSYFASVDGVNLVYDTEGNVIEFTIPSWSSIDAIKYFSICAQDVRADSIITVNEEIT